MEVLTGAFASEFTAITTEIWTECMAMLKATADSWKTTRRYADHALPFKTIRHTKSNLKWARTHPKIHKDKTIAEWSNKDWGNHLAERLAGGKPAEVTALVQRKAIHIIIIARETILSHWDHHQSYIGHPTAGPALTIGTQTAAWRRYLANRDAISLRPPY